MPHLAVEDYRTNRDALLGTRNNRETAVSLLTVMAFAIANNVDEGYPNRTVLYELFQ